MPIPTYEVVVVIPTRNDGRYVLQVAYGQRMYWFSIPVEELGEAPTYEEFKARAYLELQNMLEVVEEGTYTNPTLTVDISGQIMAIENGEPPVGTPGPQGDVGPAGPQGDVGPAGEGATTPVGTVVHAPTAP